MSTASARSRTTSSASPARAKSTSQMPSRNSCSSERAASSARRLLPTPGGPVSVTRRCSRRRSATWLSSSSRPTNDVESAGRLPRRLRSTGTAAIAGSCARIASWRRLQLEPRLEPQLVAEHAPRLLERLERVRLSAAAIERQHQLPPQALPEWVVRERRAKRRRELPMLSERQRNLELLLERVDAQRLESARLVAEPRRTGQTLQRRSAPEGQRRPNRVRRATNVAVAQRAARLREQLLEPHRVHARVPQCVPVGGADDRALAERGAKAGDVMMQRVARSGRKLLPPQAFDERVDVDHPALAERKHRQQRLTLRAAHLRERPARDNLEGAEKPDFQWRRASTTACRLHRRVSQARTRG